MDSELCEKREDKLCKGDYKYTPFAKSVLALLTENRRKFPPPSPFVCFQQFSVALISIKKNPRPYGRGYILLYELL